MTYDIGMRGIIVTPDRPLPTVNLDGTRSLSALTNLHPASHELRPGSLLTNQNPLHIAVSMTQNIPLTLDLL